MEEIKHLEVINFTNIDKEDFEGMWGGEGTIIKAGETKPFPKFLAEHYCKHLVNKILIRNQQEWSNQILRDPLEKKILGKSAEAIVKEVPQIPKTEEFAEAPKETLHAKEAKGETPIFPDIPKEKPKKAKKSNK